MPVGLRKAELLQLADEVAAVARRRLGYNYAGVLFQWSAAFFSDKSDGDVGVGDALKVLFKAYDRYVDGLDKGSRESLHILKCYILLDLAKLKPEFVPRRQRFLVRLRLLSHDLRRKVKHRDGSEVSKL